jgi:peptidylprolyl isomerase domain and WD repeat-containing protein 1
MAISIDSIGMIEFWSGSKGSYEFPEEKLNWSSKMDTDLYEYAKMQSSPHCLKIAPDGLTFATYGTDRLIRIFDIKSGKIVKTINETLQNYVDQAKENKYVFLL